MKPKFNFKECRFITNEMQFINYIDFCENRKAIKKLYKSLSDNGKIFYQWYVYANIWMSEFYKNKIWDYLNDDDPHGFELLHQLPKYKIKRNF